MACKCQKKRECGHYIMVSIFNPEGLKVYNFLEMAMIEIILTVINSTVLSVIQWVIQTSSTILAGSWS